MRILLVSPPFLHHKSEYPPLGLAYIASVLKEDNDVEGLDLNVLNGGWKTALEKKMVSFEPEIVGVYAMTTVYSSALKIIDYIKKFHPITVIGGPHPTIFPEDALKKGTNFVVRGEGEHTILELINHLKNNESLEGVKGVSFKEGKEIIHNPDRPFIDDLDRLPFPSREIFPLEKYIFFPEMNIITSRGCPFNCYFCFKGMYGKLWRARSPENVVEEIEYLKNEYVSKSIYFYDDLFTFNKERVEKFCEIVEELEIEWKCNSRVDLVDAELLTKMKRAGCTQINYGIETGDSEIMKKIKKGITLEQVRKAFHYTIKSGIRAKAYFMIGHPWDTNETIEKTIKFSKEINPSSIQFNVVSPYPGTELCRIAESMGVKISDWSELYNVRDTAPIMGTYSLSPKDIIRYKDKAIHDWSLYKTISLLRNPISLIDLVRRRGLTFPFKIFKSDVLKRKK